MSGGKGADMWEPSMTFREMEKAMKRIEKEALKKMREEYPEGVLVVISHGPEERKAIVCDWSKYEMKVRVKGKTGKYWIDSHRILKAVCPKCESEDWSTFSAGGHSMMPEQNYECCHNCAHQWGHR